MNRTTLFVVALIIWGIMTWPISAQTGRIDGSAVMAGLAVSFLVSFVMWEPSAQKCAQAYDPRRYGWAAIYLLVLMYYVVKANVDVAYRVLRPALPIRPGIVRVKSELKTHSALTVLANSITLTPGTLVVDLMDNGIIYVHWIHVATEEQGEATKRIVGRFEWFIKKICE